jgi:carbamoyl-phosphate synthase large subunit
MQNIRVLVTGAGSGVGQGIIKSLRIAGLPVTVISSDISPFHSALFRTDESILLPKVEESGSLETIVGALRSKKVDVVMIGSEFDLEFFARHRADIESRSGALVVASPLEAIQIANDKWLTAEYLRQNNLPYAETVLPANADEAAAQAKEWGYPLMLKTRRGTSSRHVHVIEDESALRSLFDRVPFPMLQKLIARPKSDLSSEFTCSVFKCKDGAVLGPFTARRTLRGGSSWVVEVDAFTDLHPLLLSIGNIMPVMGSLNVQLMMGPNGPVPLEFNARFSGTTAVRARYGFNEPGMALRSYFLKEKLSAPHIGRGLAFRYLEEVFVDGVSASDLKEPLPKGEVLKWF